MNKEKIVLDNVDTIIFDLGQVIIDLTPDLVIKGFQRHTDKTSEELIRLITESGELIDYETGQISDQEFCDACNNLLGTQIHLSEFEQIWNSFLGDMKKEKLELMQSLRSDFKVLILSNTNWIHQRAFDRMVGEQMNGLVMADMVDVAHYSQDLELRKPDPEIYQAVIEKNSLTPSRTLFFDDREDNIQSARELGINGVQVTYSNQILDQLS